MLTMLVACNQRTTNPDDLPDDIGNTGQEVPTTGLTKGLKFEFPIEMSSVFNSISIDKFVLSEYVTYSVVYTDKSGAVVKTEARGGVTEGMINADDKPLLKTPGHHNIRVTAMVDNAPVTGSFALHLKDNSGVMTLVKYTFNLRDTNGGGIAYPYFATNIDTSRAIATKNLEAGITIDSWDEFLNMFKMGLTGKALQSVSSRDVTLSATQGFPFTIETDMTFNLTWTDDVVNVEYDLNVPADAVKMSGKNDPHELFADGGKYGNLTAQRGVGRIIKPEDEEINVYNGYYFGGWFNRANDKLWRFSSSVGTEDIELYAKWVIADYSFTVYTMGGRFADNIQTLVDGDSQQEITKANAADFKYTFIDSASRFELSSGDLNRITFTGFHYGVSYDEYVSEVTLNAQGDKVVLKFSDIYRPVSDPQSETVSQPVLVKGDGDCIKIDELYTDYQCTVKLDRGDSNVDAEHPVTYVKWIFNEPDSKNAEEYRRIYDERMAKYYTEIIFKNGISVLADGSVRLTQIADWTVNELIVPEYLQFGDIKRNITEIGERALSNTKALTTVDMTQASHLTILGAEAFAYDDSLSEIVMPENSVIDLIGENAFKGTQFENNYSTLHRGAEFIVIGKMIYKFVGENRREVDLSNPSEYYTQANTPEMSDEERAKFNAQLAAVTNIEADAFARCPSLETLSISSQITTISNNGLSGLASLKTLNLPAEGSLLINIGESAFDGTKLLSTESNFYDEQLKAVIIGNVYYRFLDTAADTATIPATHKNYPITHIAPKAFVGCKALDKVTFGAEDQIVSIGKEAFLDTLIVRSNKQKDNFIVYNGILTNYYGPTIDANAYNLIVPERATTIGTYAFGKQAAYFRTLQVGANVTKIENYAFNGAVSLASLIFPDVHVSDSKLVNAPAIEEYAFADANDRMLSDVKLFFGSDVMDLFDKLEKKSVTTDDPITKDWFNLYQLNKEIFEKEDIKSVVINRNIVATNLMRKSADGKDNAFTDTYKGIIEKALIITSNTGVQRTADLGWEENEMKLIEVTQDGKYASLWENGVTKYVVTYTYNGFATGCPVEADDPNLFVITVHNAVQDIPDFYVSSIYGANRTFINVSTLTENGNFWFDGLDGQVEKAEIPTYYTSNPGLNVVLKYKDIFGEIQTVVPTKIDNLRTNAVTEKATAYIQFNFYGLGTYVFEYEYAVKMSKYISIEQTMPVVIPVNGNSAEHMRNYSVNLVGEDGNKTTMPLTRSIFGVIKVDGVETTVVNTSVLGMHTMSIEYTRGDADRTLIFDVCYTVILEADRTLFEYQVFNESYKTAYITRCLASKDITTMVLPSRCEIDGVSYTIAQIGQVQGDYKGVFEGYTKLSSVYLPETIRYIGVNTFKGCVRLQNIYTALQAESSYAEIPVNDTYFEEYGDKYSEVDADGVTWEIQPVKLLSFENLATENEIIINNDYVVDKEAHIKYRVVALNDIVLTVRNDEIDIYLPDSIYKAGIITDSQNDKVTPIYYYSGNNFIIKSANHAPELLEYIGVGAFYGCSDLEYIDISRSTKLETIGALAFAESGLKTVDLSNNTKLVDINNQVFENCVALETVVLHSLIQYIGVNAFSGDLYLESVTGLSDALIRLDTMAFNRCKSLTRIDLYDGLSNIGTNVFSSCQALTIYCHFAEKTLPSDWNSIPIVWNCDTNEIANDGLYYTVINNIRYAIDTTNNTAKVVGQMIKLGGEIVIPSTVLGKYSVVEIAENAFTGNDKIINVVAASSVKTIGANAFAGCTELMLFTFTGGNQLTYVASTAFDNCPKLAQKPQVETTISGN